MRWIPVFYLVLLPFFRTNCSFISPILDVSLKHSLRHWRNQPNTILVSSERKRSIEMNSYIIFVYLLSLYEEPTISFHIESFSILYSIYHTASTRYAIGYSSNLREERAPFSMSLHKPIRNQEWSCKRYDCRVEWLEHWWHRYPFPQCCRPWKTWKPTNGGRYYSPNVERSQYRSSWFLFFLL